MATPLERRSNYFDERQRYFIDAIQSGRIIEGILFPENLAEYSTERIRSLPYRYHNVRVFINTLTFLGMRFEEISNDIRLFLLQIRDNPTPYHLFGEYRRRLNNDALFMAFIRKMISYKQEWMRRIAEGNDVESDTESESEEEPDNEYIIPDSLVPSIIPESPEFLSIADDDTGFDAIEGDKLVKMHIAENAEHLVFVITTKSGKNAYFLSSKEQIKDVIKNKSNIQYICKIYGAHILHVPKSAVHFERPLFRIASIGVSIPYVYLDQIKYLLESPKQVYIISNEPVENAIAVASHDILDGGNAVSGSHCQYVEGNLPYPIYSLTSMKDTIVEDDDVATLVDSDTDVATLVDSDTDIGSDTENSPPRKRTRIGGKTRNKRKNKTHTRKKKRSKTRRNKKKSIRRGKSM